MEQQRAAQTTTWPLQSWVRAFGYSLNGTLHTVAVRLLVFHGTGHIGLAVPDVNAACARFEELGVEFAKKPGGTACEGGALHQNAMGAVHQPGVLAVLGT